MAEQVATEAIDLSALTGSPGSKRKRESHSPSTQRAKRPAPAPAATMGVSAADTQAFIDNAIEASHTAAANGVSVADFNALQLAAAAAEQSEATDPSTATSTAQAALGMYPTLHVPPSTEEQFAAQAAAEDEEASQDGPYGPELSQTDGLMDGSGVDPNIDGMPNGILTQTHRFSNSGPGTTPKPTVGSEEWHKMRKDNHKEGKFYFIGNPFTNVSKGTR